METMDVQVQRTLVIPAPLAQPTEEVPFTVFDRVAPTYHVTVLFAFAAPNPTAAALAATLPRFPILTARIDRCLPAFVTGDGGAGALVVETAVGSALADLLPLAPSPGLARLHVALDDKDRLLRVQINRFSCGGLVVASSAHHQAADGYSMSTFFNAWVDAVRAAAAGDGALNNNQQLPVVPYGPGALVPRRPPRCEFEHRGAEFLPKRDAQQRRPDPDPVRVAPSEIANLTLHYTPEFIAQLKAATAAHGHHKHTTFEAVSAHLWRKITLSRASAADPAPTSLNVSVNGRARLGPDSIARGFFGNVVLTARSSAGAAADLAHATLADAAARVRAGVRAVDARYFQSFIDFGELLRLHEEEEEEEEEELEPAVGDEDYVLLPDVASDSWLHLELHNLDFGCGGRLLGVLPAFIPLDGVIVLIPSLQKEGGVDVFVALYHKHAEELRNIAYTMD